MGKRLFRRFAARNENVYAVLLAGGRGRRLWPLSRRRLAKPFIRIKGGKTFFSETFCNLTPLVNRRNIFAVTNANHAKLIKEIPQKNILIEPDNKNTASAIGLAAMRIFRENPDSILVVLSVDHLIQRRKGFLETLKCGIRFVDKNRGSLLLVGAKPRDAKTTFGYMEKGERNAPGVYRVKKFCEKPEKNLAERFVRSKKFLWNTGMFVWRAADILFAIKRHAPHLYKELKNVEKNPKNIKRAYSRMKDLSIDYQVLEKAKNLYCIECAFGWNDMGLWENMGDIVPKDNSGNVVSGNVEAIDAKDSIIVNSRKNHLIGAVGLKDVIVIHTEDATLVCDKKKSAGVKELVDKINIMRTKRKFV